MPPSLAGMGFAPLLVRATFIILAMLFEGEGWRSGNPVWAQTRTY